MVNLGMITQSFRLREYYYMLLRHKLYFFGAIFASMFIALILTFVLPKSYRAETVLLIQEEKFLNPLISGLAISPGMAERLRTLKEELLSWQRLTLLAEKLGMDKTTKNQYEYEQMIRSLRDHVSVKMKGHDIITIRFEGADPKQAQKIVQTLSDIIIQGNLASQNLEANSAIRFIEEQLEAYRTKLEKSEAELRTFQELYESTLPVASRLNDQLVNLKMQLNTLLIDNTEEHPEVIKTKQLIEDLQKQRDAQFNLAKEQGLDIDSKRYNEFTSVTPVHEQQLAKLQRNYAVNDQMYQSLLNRLETAKISQTLEQSDKGTKFFILEPARLPLKPVSPNKFMLLFGGFLVGLGLGCVLIYFLEFGDNSIRTVDDARLLLEQPILGWIGTIHPEELLLEHQARSAVHV
ncbi:MAG: hypothetical protein HY582_00025 [Candidatus Omnitrophica bacterium]|nr:hypothetical protein [Candidatus Omnitrophota bacterium]